jgi:hypothetical protein
MEPGQAQKRVCKSLAAYLSFDERRQAWTVKKKRALSLLFIDPTSRSIAGMLAE